MKHLFLHKYYHNSKQSYISSWSTLVLDSVQATHRDWQKNSDPTTRTYWKGRFITGWYKSPQKQEVPKLKRDFWSSATQFWRSASELCNLTILWIYIWILEILKFQWLNTVSFMKKRRPMCILWFLCIGEIVLVCCLKWKGVQYCTCTISQCTDTWMKPWFSRTIFLAINIHPKKSNC